MGAYATDFVERTWPVTYGGKGSARQEDGASKGLGYPSEGGYPIAFPEEPLPVGSGQGGRQSASAATASS